MTDRRLRTFGHGTATQEALADLLTEAGTDTVVRPPLPRQPAAPPRGA